MLHQFLLKRPQSLWSVAVALAAVYSCLVPPLEHTRPALSHRDGRTAPGLPASGCDDPFDLTCTLRIAASAPHLRLRIETALPAGLGELDQLLPTLERAGLSSRLNPTEFRVQFHRLDLSFTVPTSSHAEHRQRALNRHNI